MTKYNIPGLLGLSKKWLKNDGVSQFDVVFGAKKRTGHRSKTKAFNGEYVLHITVNWQYNAWKLIRLAQPGNEPKDWQGQTRSSSMYQIWVCAYLWKYLRKILKNVYIVTMSLSMHYRFEQKKYVSCSNVVISHLKLYIWMFKLFKGKDTRFACKAG